MITTCNKYAEFCDGHIHLTIDIGEWCSDPLVVAVVLVVVVVVITSVCGVMVMLLSVSEVCW